MLYCRENNVFVGVLAFKVPAAMHVVIQEGNAVFTGTKSGHLPMKLPSKYMLLPPTCVFVKNVSETFIVQLL
jgi:hypothetical protein